MADGTTGSYIDVRSLRAYLARPDGGDNGAGMLLLPMLTGIGQEIREFAHTIAGLGVSALVWDPWHGPSLDDTPRATLAEYMARLDDETASTEQRWLLDHLVNALGLRRVGVIGFCLGGRFALLLAGQDERVSNVVAFHPTVPIPPAENHTLDVPEHCQRIQAPVLMLYPGADHLVPRESFDAMQTALQRRETGATLVHLYPAAGHGFSSGANQQDEVNVAAARLAWPQALDFIRTTLAAG